VGGSRRRYLAIVFIMLVAGLSCSPQILEGYGGISSRVDFTDDFGATWNDEWLDYHMGFECHIGDLSAGMRAIHDEDRFEKTVLLDAWG